MLNIVLHEPEIPFNTGAIGRTCVATNTRLHLIEPFGFILNDKYIKRAGMDYWDRLDVTRYINYEGFLKQNGLTAYLPGNPGKESRAAESLLCMEQRTQTAAEASAGQHAQVKAVPDSGEAQAVSETDSAARNTAQPKLWFATTKAQQTYCDVSIGPDDFIMFGKESAGIPEELLVEHPAQCIRIPMWGDIRSLNLSNSVAVILYEALRQNSFENMEKQGRLHQLHW